MSFRSILQPLPPNDAELAPSAAVRSQLEEIAGSTAVFVYRYEDNVRGRKMRIGVRGYAFRRELVVGDDQDVENVWKMIVAESEAL